MTRIDAVPRPLSPREHEVLRGIVTHYVQTGTPVASRSLSKLNSEGLSPASIRNIMVDLEEAGFLAHPHASAGRVPTDLGYRYYVNTLQPHGGLSSLERQTLAQDLTAEGEIESLVSRCCKLLSAASSQVAVGTGPETGSTVFQHVEFVKITDERLLVLFITASGLVHRTVLDAKVPESRDELARYANYLNQELAGRTLVEVRDHVRELMAAERAAYDTLARRALTLGSRYFLESDPQADELVVDGTTRLIESPPSLEDFDRMKALLSALGEKSRILRLLNGCLQREGVVTAIGSETEDPILEGCSLVAATYGHNDERIGTIGIIGPKRMDYDRAIRLVGYVADLLGSTLGRVRS
jgi:heat-inducible transcriptional repressor